MRTALTLVLLAAVCVPITADAQQAGENINVLPVVFPHDDPDHWFLKGDGFLQRQVEPTIAASTRNPDHLLAFFVDYRAVDIADDIGLGETNTQVALFNTGRTILMASSGLSVPRLPTAGLPPIAAAEAWIGMSRSYDGGLTWSGGFLPGAPFDTGSTLSTPVDGLEAASDPALVAGPCGKFYLAFMAFTRGGESKLVVARYQDLNTAGGGDSIVYQGMTVIDAGSSTKCNDYFIDKPDIEVDIYRGSCGDVCADRVYVSYSTFFEQNPDGTFSSDINVARSWDGGLSFAKKKVNWPYSQNQGSALAVDPRNGIVYVFWRHFNHPDAVLMSKSTSYGKRWSWPKKVTKNVPMAAFDQPSISISEAFAAGATSPENPGFPEVAFRTNGFPTAAVTDDGTLFAAWQERVDEFGRPSEIGSPRIVVVRSTNKGKHWYDINGDPDRLAVDVGMRDVPGDPNLPAPGFGALPLYRYAGPQVQPKLAFSAGQLLLAYYESRGRIANYGYSQAGAEAVVPWDVQTTSFISGYDRLIDFRAALLDPDTGALRSTTQVSRYPIRTDANLHDGEDLMDVAPVSWPCWPDSGEPTDPACVRQVNRSGMTQSSIGTVPFIGDYPDVAPIQQFVYDGTEWRWATDATDVPYQGFHTVFTDNRHLLPPSGPEEWYGFQFYDPPWESLPNNLPGCTNPGSRNTDVLTSKIDTTMVLSAPTTYKDLDDARGFPFSVKNRTGESRVYRLEITEGIFGSSFNLYDDTVHGGDVEIFAFSNGSFTVYVNAGFPDPVKVQVSEVCPPPAGFAYACSNSVGTLVFNADSGYDQVPALNGPDTQAPEIVGDPFFVVAGDSGDPANPFVVNPFVVNPFVVNPFVVNPFVVNPFVVNPFVVNPFVVNPFVVNTAPEDIEAVIDTTWTVSPGESNSASSYLPLINIDNAQAFIDSGYVFQLIVHKGSLYGGLAGCNSVNVAQPQILANVYQDPGAANPFVVNPFVVNPFVVNPFVVNPFVVNSSFNMAPADDPMAIPDDGTTKAPPASTEIGVTLRAFKIAQGGLGAVEGGGELKDGGLVYRPWEDPPSLVIVPQPCDPDDPGSDCHVLSVSPDLVLVGVDTTPVTATAGRTLDGFPSGGWTLFNEGLQNQTIGDATAENGILRHGFYICDLTYIDTWPADEPLGLAGCTAIAEFQPSGSDTLELWESESFGAIDLSIPSDLEAGDYYLVLHADDTLEVSERTETNNWIAVLFTVEVNYPPVVDLEATSLTVWEDPNEPLSALLATDPNEDPLTAEVVSGPTHGTLTFDGATFSYMPDENYFGSDSFDVNITDGDLTVGATVVITIEAVNDAPVAAGAAFVTDEDTPVTGTLVATDVEDDDLIFDVVTSPEHGSVAIDGNSFTFVPEDDYNGPASFTFRAYDGTDVSDTAVIDITVNPVNDAPTVADLELEVAEDGSVAGTVVADDVDGDTLSFTFDPEPILGSVSPIDPLTGAFTYTPSPDENGTDTFGVTVSDGELGASAIVSVVVTAVNDAPVAENASLNTLEDVDLDGAAAADDVDGDPITFILVSGPANGSLAFNGDGSFTFEPNPDFNGEDGFSFKATDGELESEPASITITVVAVNDAPVAEPGSLTAAEDTVGTGAVAASDIDGDPLSYSVVTEPIHGVLTFNPDGSYSYTPTADFNGDDSFAFEVSDGSLTDQSAVAITIIPVNDAPIASDAAFSTFERTAVGGFLQGDDVDQGDVLSFSLGTQPSGGAIDIDPASGAFTYTPVAGFVGTDDFTFLVLDTAGASAIGTVTVTVEELPEWDFKGFLSPWHPGLELDDDDSIWLKWKYLDPVTGAVVDSSMATPEITITRYSSCSGTGSIRQQWTTSASSYIGDKWKYKFRANGLNNGCYFFSITHPYTGQVNTHSHNGDPLKVRVDED